MKSGDNRDRIEATSAMVLTRERRTTSSPRRKISTSLVSNWNSLGKRTAWELPLLKTLAVLMAGLHQSCTYLEYIHDPADGQAARPALMRCREPGGR